MKNLFILLLALMYCENVFSQWVSQNSNTVADLTSVFFYTENLGWISCSDGDILRTTDGGINWNSYPASQGSILHDVYFGDEYNGFALGDDKIFKSTNGGLTWTDSIVFSPGVKLRSIYFLDNAKGFLTTASSKILKTTNFGITWREVFVDSVPLFSGIFFRDSSTGWVSASGGYPNGKIYKTTDGGELWSKIYESNQKIFEIKGFPNSDTLLSIEGFLSLTGAVFVNSLNRSFDGGNIWTRINVNAFPDAFYFSSPNVGRIIGRFSYYSNFERIARTTDGGSSWTIEDSTEGNIYSDWYFKTYDKGWLVGWKGIIKHWNIRTDETIKNDFNLFNNYPNPFNSTTTIKFSIPNSDYVTLKVYNLLGKEVAVLISREMNEGLHTIRWNAFNFPSGVYLSRLQTGKYIQAKTLLLIK